MGENLDEDKKGIVSSVFKKEKATAVSTKLNFFDMPNQLLPEKIMKFFLPVLLLISCSEKNSNYFPLDKIKSWTYAVEIIPK